MAEEVTTAKKTVRVKKTVSDVIDVPESKPRTITLKDLGFLITDLETLADEIRQHKDDLERLEREIDQTHALWRQEKDNHDKEVADEKNQEAISRKREQETYEYETGLARKRAEDEFAAEKAAWKKELDAQKDQLAAERKELDQLRKTVADFPDEQQRAVKEAVVAAQKQMDNEYIVEKRLRDQEVKAEKDVLTLKIESLSAENSRQAKEIEGLRQGLDQATSQVKDIAVKVIESGSQNLKTPNPES